MDAYRYQQLAYLVLPVMLGLEFFMSARDEKMGKEETPLGFYLLEFFGFIFMALFPAIFIFTIWAIESKAFPHQTLPLARLDRYAVMFFFMGSWWQVYLFGALRARRMLNQEMKPIYLWLPFLGLGIFISLLVLWVSPWNMKWISVAWFLLIFGALNLIKARVKTIERAFWVLAGLTFVVENFLFLWLDSIV